MLRGCKSIFVGIPILVSGSAFSANAATKPVTAQPTVVEAEAEPNFDFRGTLHAGDSPTGHSPAMLLLGYQPGGSYLQVTIVADSVSLARVSGGRSRSIATVNGVRAPAPGQEAAFTAQWRQGELRLIDNGRTVLRRAGLGALSGAVAVQTHNASMEFREPMCQPVEGVHLTDDFMRTAGEKGAWETVNGTWKVRSAADPAKVSNAFTYSGEGKAAMTVTGRWFWDDYRTSVSVRPAGAGAVGVVAYWQDAANYLLFKWLPANDPAAPGWEKQLWRVWHGQTTLLAAAPGGYEPKQWYRLAMRVGGGLLTVAVDGQRVLQKQSDVLGQGKAGLYCDNDTDALFDDVLVDALNGDEEPLELRREAIVPQFTKEESMDNWAKPKAEWLPATNAAAGDSLFWHRGWFFGDYAVELKATGLEASNAKVTAILGGDGDAASSGYALVVSHGADPRHVAAALLRNGRKVAAAASVAYYPAQGTLKLERTGHTVRASVSGQPVAAFNDSSPLRGRRAGYAVQNAAVTFDDAHVTADHIYDYTFYHAPVDWKVSGGTWDVTSRWDCTPTWSWYGGSSPRIAAIWDKHQFVGDYAMEVFVAARREAGAYKHPRDFNITVAGDGKDLASGYSCIFGGWNNSITRILRGTKPVAETKQFLLPTNYQGEAHHKWFCLRVEKVGNTVSFFIDRKLAIKYQDPQPLTGQHLALWTLDNNFTIARATIYYQQEAPRELPQSTPNTALRAVHVDKLHWAVRGGDAGVRLTAVSTPVGHDRNQLGVQALDAGGGGEFATVPELQPFDALKTPKLSFDMLAAPGDETNLYLKIKGVYHTVYLTGQPLAADAGGAKTVGSVRVPADSQWHRVNLDLAALLKPLYPKESALPVDELFLGNLVSDEYRKAGFGSNAAGSSYAVRGFSLRSPNNLLAQVVEPEITTHATLSPVALVPPLALAKPAPVPTVVSTHPRADASHLPRGLYNLRAAYYQDPEHGGFRPELLNKPVSWKGFTKPVITQPVDSINFDWTNKSPAPGVRPTYWSARFTGKLVVPQLDDYVFYLDRLDDGARLSIDGKLVIDSWLVQAATTHPSKAVHLLPGLHSLRVDYCQGTGNSTLSLRWSSSHFPSEVVAKTSSIAGIPGIVASVPQR